MRLILIINQLLYLRVVAENIKITKYKMNTIVNFFASQTSPIVQALYAGLFTWILTAIGAGLVFFLNTTSRKFLDAALGFTGGVMIAASFWSLLSPAITAVEMQNELVFHPYHHFYHLQLVFFFGAIFMYFLDKSIPHLHIFGKIEEAEGPKTDLKKTSLTSISNCNS